MGEQRDSLSNSIYSQIGFTFYLFFLNIINIRFFKLSQLDFLSDLKASVTHHSFLQDQRHDLLHEPLTGLTLFGHFLLAVVLKELTHSVAPFEFFLSKFWSIIQTDVVVKQGFSHYTLIFLAFFIVFFKSLQNMSFMCMSVCWCYTYWFV